MSVPRVLVLTSLSLSDTHAGSIFLPELLAHYPKDKIFCFCLSSNGKNYQTDGFSGIKTYCASRPHESGLKRFGDKFGKLSSYLIHEKIKCYDGRLLTKKAVQFGQENKVNLVWAILDCPSIIYTAIPIANTLNIPLVSTATDPPERFFESLHINQYSLNMLSKLFVRTLQYSIRCGVASDGMREQYKALYKVDSAVMIHGVRTDQIRMPARTLSTPGMFIIGFAGSLYAREEWAALIAALDCANWRICGRDVKVVVLGGWFHARAIGKMRIEYLGWRSVEETLEVIAGVDVSYLPYWFAESYASTVKVCFPNKLSIYLAAGRPVFYHGPEYGSPVRFLKRFPAGVCCHSLKPGEIIEALSKLISDPEFYSRAAVQSKIAAETELNLTVFLKSFAYLIGVEFDQLLCNI